MGQGYIDVTGFCGNFQLFVNGLAVDGAQIVQSVCHLDQNHPYVQYQGTQYLLEVFCLWAFCIVVTAIQFG